MGSSSIDVENLSPKTKIMMKYIKKLEEKIEKLRRGLEYMRLHTQSVNVKEKKKKDVFRKESEGIHDEGYRSHLSRFSRSQRSGRIRRHKRHKEDPKRTPIELIKGKISPFLCDRRPNVYYDWEMEVKQNLECFDCEDVIKVKLIILSFKYYALIWWNEISINIRRMRITFIESWDELKK
ncbi:hypothetical protein CR513_03107, partial [Mucuna pruriens]